MINPHAMYIYCDGAMDYAPSNPGGIGFVITFPDSVPLPSIQQSMGKFVRANIEILEVGALMMAMKEVIETFKQNGDILSCVKHVIFVTDRFMLSDKERTNAYKIHAWRKNRWKSHEGKPIKNHNLLDDIDKSRKKLAVLARCRVEIEWRPRKQNKIANKLAQAGKNIALVNESLAKKGEKIGRRIYEGAEIKYSALNPNDKLHIHVFRKDPVQQEWEVWVELCDGLWKGNKLKIYSDDKLAARLQRRNEYLVRIKSVFTHHVRIYRIIKKKNKTLSLNKLTDSTSN